MDLRVVLRRIVVPTIVAARDMESVKPGKNMHMVVDECC